VHARRIDGARAYGPGHGPALVAVGNFDGVHAGHRAMLGAARAEAESSGLARVVLTFDPHPAEVLGRGRQAVLTPLGRKIELLARFDPQLVVVVEPFTLDLASMSPRQFASDLLRDALAARLVMVGQNFRFGRDRAGDLAMLSALGRELGFEARAEPLAGDKGGPYSSSRIRAALGEGNVDDAERLLGRPHALTGTVARGDGRGRTLGVPTANLVEIDETSPAFGVYACLADRFGPDGAFRAETGVVNVGNRPTLQAGFSVEVHLHDFEGDLYGERLRVHLLSRLRDEQKFPSLEALTAQIRADVEAARRVGEARAASATGVGGWY